MTDNPITTDIKLVVLDVDNTLLNDDHELSERNIDVIKQVLEKGIRVILATGKAYGSCKGIIEQLGIKDPCIFTQGLTIHEPDGTVKHQKTLDPEVARQVITFAEDRGFALVMYSQGRLLSRRANPHVDALHTKWKEVKPEYVGPLQNVLNKQPVNKLIAVSETSGKHLKALRWQLNAQLNGNATLMSGGVGNMLEVMPPNASKGKALKMLLREMDIKPEQVLAIGDAENDLEMIQVAGIGIAVENAQQALKDASDDITASNHEDGVARALEKYVLGKHTPQQPDTTPPADAADQPDATTDRVDTPKPEGDVPPTSAAAQTELPKPEDSLPNQDS